MTFTASTYNGGGADGPMHRGQRSNSRRDRIRLRAAAAAASGLLAAATVLSTAAPAGASTSAAAAPASASTAGAPASASTAGVPGSAAALALRAMPRGAVTFGRTRRGYLTVRAAMYGLTPGSSHNVDIVTPGRFRVVRLSPLTANSVGQADSTLRSNFTRNLPRGSRLLVRMGVQGGGVAKNPIAVTGPLGNPGRPYPLIPVEVGPGGTSYGTPRGRATISYSARLRTLTVTVQASGLTPGPHAAHIHLGSCESQGPVLYMLKDLVANRRGQIVHAVRVFTHVTKPIPAHGWYLNIHQGNSGNILSHGQPTIYFRPLLCANIAGTGPISSISTILRAEDIVTGVRGETRGNVVLTGLAAIGSGTQTAPFLYRGRLASAAGAAVSLLRPSFGGVTTAMFYGPDTHRFNPASIRKGQVRAVGTYESSSAPAGVLDQGMIYLGPLSGPGGSWTSIDVPARGAHVVGHVHACPTIRRNCFVMDTIPHSTMGNLVVGNYDLSPAVHGGVISGNAFIYNMSRRQWTLLRLGGSLASKTSIYGIWQDGGDGSPRYTLAGGSSAHGSSARGNQRAFLMNYNERTGIFGKPKFFSYANAPALFTHFEGITAVRGGFNLVTQSSAETVSMAFVPFNASTGVFGTAKWYPVNVTGSPVCPSGCSAVTGNTVYENHAMGLYIQTGSTDRHTYLATISGG